MRTLLMCCCVIALLYSCGGSKEESGTILTTAKMQDVMWDMLLADAFTEKYLKTDSSKKELVQNAALQQKVFELHKITKGDFYKSYNYYNNHPDLMRIILDSIGVKADRERNGLMNERYSQGRVPPPPSITDSARRAHERQ